MTIRLASDEDKDAIWAILEPMIRRGETYPLPREMSKSQALEYWFTPENEIFAWHDGGAAHVANCGYVTAAGAEGRGIARAMCLHSLQRSRERGFRAMQFNFVVSANSRAVKLWSDLGFKIVGCLPGAFEHPEHGFVDALVMYKQLS